MSLSFVTFFGAGLFSLLLATTVAEAGGRGRLFEKPDQDGDGAVIREVWHVAPERHQRKAPKEPVE